MFEMWAGKLNNLTSWQICGKKLPTHRCRLLLLQLFLSLAKQEIINLKRHIFRIRRKKKRDKKLFRRNSRKSYFFKLNFELNMNPCTFMFAQNKERKRTWGNGLPEMRHERVTLTPGLPKTNFSGTRISGLHAKSVAKMSSHILSWSLEPDKSGFTNYFGHWDSWWQLNWYNYQIFVECRR